MNVKKIVLTVLLLVLIIPLSVSTAEEKEDQEALSPFERLEKIASEKGFAKLILKLEVKNIQQLTAKSTSYKTVVPGLKFPSAGIQADLDLENAIQTAAFSVLHQLNGLNYQVNHTFSTLPYLALDVSSEVLDVLAALPEVLAIYEDKPRKLIDYRETGNTSKGPLEYPFSPDDSNPPLLTTSTDLVGAADAWDMGYTGSGWYVAILDTGIRRTHLFFQGKTIKEACYSAKSECPNGKTSMTGTGAAAHYDSSYYGFDHGTHVAGIAAGKNGSMAGVAKNSSIIAVQVFSPFGSEDCGGDPCVLSYDSDQVKGLEYIYTLRGTYSIAAANMSLGGGYYTSYCNSEPQKAAIDNLKSVRIATVVATGNDGYCGSISSPACVSSAVAVGASDKNDKEAYFNNWHVSLQEFFAPGVSIYSSTGDSNSSYQSWSGTSMATPHVTGAWALLRQASPTASVDQIFNALESTGISINTMCWTGGACPRIQVDDAIETLATTTSIKVTSPNGGESWTTGSSHAITWTSSGSVGNVKIRYSTNNGSSWTTIASSTANDGSYSWTIPNTTSSQCKVKVEEASTGSPSDTSDAVFSIIEPPGTPAEISLSRLQLNFSAIAGISGAVTDPQVIWINNTGDETLNWSTDCGSAWLLCTPASGTNAGVLTISVDTTSLAVGEYSSNITINAPNATNSPQVIWVNLKVINPSQNQPPFGTLETPLDGSTVRSSIPVTGWVLDDVNVEHVKIYSNGAYIGDVVFSEGARPDVQQAYPGYPGNHLAGWGYMMLTNMLPDGTYSLKAVATDNTGNQVTLGSKTIKIDNQSAVKPFGAIDTPSQGGNASGAKFRNQGWTLTPQPNKIPEDGSTINVYVDGKYLGHTVYNIFRADIFSLFPGYANSSGALAYLDFDTTAFANGVHTIQWTVTDNAGNNDGIGSRYFTIGNTGIANKTQSAGYNVNDLRHFSIDYFNPIRFKKGYEKNSEPGEIYPDHNGIVTIEIKELERTVIYFSKGTNESVTQGFQIIGNGFTPLPIGSVLDRGTFYWQPGPGFVGEYWFAFINKDTRMLRKVNIRILPKYELKNH